MSKSVTISSVECALNSRHPFAIIGGAYLSSRTNVRIMSDLAEIELLRSYWSAWCAIPNSDIDQYLTVVKNVPDAKPVVIAIYRDAQPCTLLVGRLERGIVGLRIGYCDVVKKNVRQLVFIHGGLMGDVSNESCEALMDAIRGLLRTKVADVAYFNSLNTNLPLHGALRSQGFVVRDHFPVVERHRMIELPGSSQEFYQMLSPKVRKNLGWQSRKLQKQFSAKNVRIERFRNGADLDEMFRDVEAIAGKAYQRGLGVGFVDTPMVRCLMELAARKKWLRAYVLYISERPAAFWIGRLYKRMFFSDYMGYDAEFAKYSPGMFVITSVIERFCDHKDGEIIGAVDFGLGDAQYKEVLGSNEWLDASLYMFSPTVSAIALNLLRTPVTGLDQLARRILSRINLLQKSKRLWRNKIVRQVKMGTEA